MGDATEAAGITAFAGSGQQAAYEQVEEARQTVALYTSQYLPFAEQNLALARAN